MCPCCGLISQRQTRRLLPHGHLHINDKTKREQRIGEAAGFPTRAIDLDFGICQLAEDSDLRLPLRFITSVIISYCHLLILRAALVSSFGVFKFLYVYVYVIYFTGDEGQKRGSPH